MDRLAVFQGDHPEESTKFTHENPMADPAIRLRLAPDRIPDGFFTPLHFQIRAFPNDLLGKVPGRLHRPSFSHFPEKRNRGRRKMGRGTER